MEDEDLVQEERARKAAVRKTKVETDLTTEDAEQLEKKAVSVEMGNIIHNCFHTYIHTDGYS